MLKNKIVRRVALVISFLMLLTSTVNITYGYIVTKTDSVINTFIPLESNDNGFTIMKRVEHPLGETYTIPEHITFDFRVDLGTAYGNTSVQTSAGTMMADENGIIIVSVKPGKNFSVSEIEPGTRVRVTELQDVGNGFTVKDGVATKEITIATDDNAILDFVNFYTPASANPATVKVVGEKILSGRDWQNGDEFSFTLEQRQDDGSWLSLGTKTVVHDREDENFNHFDFNDIFHTLIFDKVGTYNFRMTEVAGNLENIDYDRSINTFTLVVTDVDMDGVLEINAVTAAQNATVTEENGVHTISVIFNNAFVPAVPEPEDIEINISVEKNVNNTGTVSISPEGFEFVLENTTSGERITLKTGANGKALFALPFTADDAGRTFTYQLFEIDQGMKGVTYDKRVYDIRIAVTMGVDNKLVAGVTVNDKAVVNAEVKFANTYHGEKPVFPQTGDTNNSTFWFFMMLVSGGACIVLLVLDRKYLLK